MIPVTAFVSVEILMMSHGASAAAQTPSGERRKFVRRVISDQERHLARAEPSARGRQTPGQATPVKAVSRRSRAREPRALTGVDWSGIDLQSVMRISFRSDRQNARLGSAPTTHCADLLTARENLRCCNVRSCQKKCDKALYYLTTDRGAPCAFYPAIKRSMSRASPVLRNSSTSCDQAKSGSASQEQIACRFRAVDMQALW